MYCGHQRRRCASKPGEREPGGERKASDQRAQLRGQNRPERRRSDRLKRNDAPQIAASETSRATSACLI